MIVAFSTSSREASVALIAPGGGLIWSAAADAPQTASGATIDLLKSGLRAVGAELRATSLFAADLGPGSFTGVRVGVTLAKTLAYVIGVPSSGIGAFDLIDRDRTVVLPSKRGEWFVREPGMAPRRSAALPEGDFVGCGPGLPIQTYPHAKCFAAVISLLQPIPAEQLVPAYLIEPSISTPKRPFGGETASL